VQEESKHDTKHHPHGAEGWTVYTQRCAYIGQPFVFSYRVLAIAAANEFQVYLGGVRDDYPLFYLFLAEFLADEGM
jgi:hypothetical protein